jgi:hypothetical protein
MTSPTVELATFKSLSVLGVTITSSFPAVMAVLEPATFADVHTRMFYCGISFFSASIVLFMFRPKDKLEFIGRLLAAVIVCFCFVEPLAEQIKPYFSTVQVNGIEPVNAAFAAAFFFGTCAWWLVGIIVWFIKNPGRLFKLPEWWAGKRTFQSVFIEDPGSARETRTNGGSQAQPGISDTLTPSQRPTQTPTPSESTSGSDKSKTT